MEEEKVTKVMSLCQLMRLILMCSKLWKKLPYR